jgi:predicted nucleic acid-binding protein
MPAPPCCEHPATKRFDALSRHQLPRTALLEEAASAKVEHFVAALPLGEAAVSHWTRVEFASLLAREVRMGGLKPQAADEAGAQFEAVVQESFIILPPDAHDFDLARSFLGNYATGLRAGDALHLAIAGNRGATAIYSLDKGLLKAGRILKLPVSTGIRVA